MDPNDLTFVQQSMLDLARDTMPDVICPAKELAQQDVPVSDAPTISSVILGRMQKELAAAIGDLTAGGFIQTNEDRLDMEDCMVQAMDDLAQRMSEVCPWAFQREVCRTFVTKTLGA